MSEAPRKSNYKPCGEVISNEGKLLTEAGASPHMERQATQGKLHKSKKKKHGKRKQKTQTNSGQNHKEKDPRKAAHILREKEKKRSAIYVGNPSCERLGGEFLGCWKCWKCWECWKIYDFSTLSMFSMLSMLQKEGNAAQESPSLRTQFAPNTAQGSAQVPQGRNSTAGATAQCRGAHKFHKGETARQGRQHRAGGAHKLHKGETARQGRQHSAEKRTSSAGRQERQLRKAGTRAAGSQKLRLWRSLFWKPIIMLSLSVARYALTCSSSLRISRASNHVPMIATMIRINTINPIINQTANVVNTASITFPP